MTVPTARKGGAMYQAEAPNIQNRARASWAALEAKAPATPTPIQLTRVLKSLRIPAMRTAEVTLPAAENTKM